MTTMFPCCRSPDSCDAGTILSALRESVDQTQPPTQFNINRSHVWEGVRRAVLRSSYTALKTISVKFTDDIGTAEGAVDEGGPRREMLQLTMEHLRNTSCLFAGPSDHKHLNPLQHGTAALQICFFSRFYLYIFYQRVQGS